jgi:hypothetical protein
VTGDVEELVVLDLSDLHVLDRRADRRLFEEQYAQLAFGLGTVPRRRHVDEPFWRQPWFVVGGALALLMLSATAH